MLSPDERLLLLRYCWDHLVAECPVCEGTYRLDELTGELFGLYSSSELCPRCRIPLVESIRAHMAACTVLRVQAAEARERAQATREQSRQLQKESQQARDRADVVGAEAESLRDKAERLRRQRPGEC